MSDNKEDKSAFKSAMGKVTPLNKPQKVSFKKKVSIQPKSEQTLPPISSGLSSTINHEVTAEQSLLYAHSSISSQIIRKLQRGQFHCEAVLDCHGLRVAEAETALLHFIKSCRTQKYRCVRIVHGKGYNTAPQQITIKSYMNSWLREIPDVLAFCSCQPKDGGTGAVNILLRGK